MVAFLAGSAILLALVSAWVFSRFSPQGLSIGLRAPRVTTEPPRPAPHVQRPPAISPSAVPVQASPSNPAPAPWSQPPAASNAPKASPSAIQTTIAARLAVGVPRPAPSRIVAPTPHSPSASASSTPLPPAAPSAVTAVAGTLSATVTWTAPAAGSSPIIGYTITPYLGSTAQPTVVVNGTPLATSVTITGLRTESYTFTVSATNSSGSGPASAPSNAVVPTPAPTVPAAPTAVTATAGSTSAVISWTAPADGGSPLTSYRITPYLAGVAQASVTVTGNPPATTVTINGLAVSTYTFTVSAINAIGTSVESAPSAAVTTVP